MAPASTCANDHLRLVFLAPTDVLDDAVDRLGRFLSTYQQ